MYTYTTHIIYESFTDSHANISNTSTYMTKKQGTRTERGIWENLEGGKERGE